MNKTSIEWTDYTWNPVTGCTKVSAGCRSCYAETLAKRFWGKRKFTDVKMHPERLDEVLYMGRKLDGKKIFVCDVSDLFHDDVTDYFIYDILEIIHNYPDTVFQILTKRIDRAVTIFKNLPEARLIEMPQNIWLGTSCENQETANERIPLLLQIPAAVRFLSCEPLIGPIDLTNNDWFPAPNYPIKDLQKGINWVIAGGESGHTARPMHPDWVRSLRDQCKAANVPFFFKQWGEWAPDSHVSGNHPFLIRSPKHYLVNIDGETYPYGDQLLWPGERSRYTDKENERASECTLTKEDNAYFMANVGKSKAGNMLDGKQHLEFPV